MLVNWRRVTDSINVIKEKVVCFREKEKGPRTHWKPGEESNTYSRIRTGRHPPPHRPPLPVCHNSRCASGGGVLEGFSLLQANASYWSLGALTLQQVIVASSNIWLVQATRAVASASAGTEVFIGLYLGSLLAPYVPGSMSQTWAVKWKHELVENYMSRLASAHYGNTGAWQNSHACDNVATMCSSEGRKVLSEAVGALHDAVACSLNVFLNIAALSILIDPFLSMAYASSAGAGILFIRHNKEKQKRLASNAYESELQLNDRSKAFKDNVFLGNARNFSRYRQGNEDNLRDWHKNSMRSALFTRFVGISTTFITAAPVVLTIGYRMHTQLNNPVLLAASLVSLPRLLNTINFIDTLTAAYVESTPLIERIKRVYSAERPLPVENLIKRINPEKIKIMHNDLVVPVATILGDPVLIQQPGRWTITGDNRAGKSSLLLHLKSRFADSSYYLPAKHSLDIGPTSGDSSGGLVLSTLNDVLADDNVEVFLLDEWDAFLAEGARKEVDERINLIAKTRSIVEVTHNRRLPTSTR